MPRVVGSVLMTFILSLSVTITITTTTTATEEAFILVNADNYARAEAAFQFEGMAKRTGESNELSHARQPIPLDR